jgi:hypothetical protein
MAYKDEDDEIECEILESYGSFSNVYKSWIKEVNLISWNRRPAKLDIRSWQKDHEKCGKGIAITREEAEELVKLLGKILKARPKEEKAKKEEKPKAKKKPVPPETLEPFYDELELIFGVEPSACKSARNALLKKYHPDKNAKNVAFATRKTIKIKEAYEAILAWWNSVSVN